MVVVERFYTDADFIADTGSFKIVSKSMKVLS